MSGTIRANGANSDREWRRATVTRARRARNGERVTLRALDDRAIALRTSQNGA
jgi:hypothetical protein